MSTKTSRELSLWTCNGLRAATAAPLLGLALLGAGCTEQSKPAPTNLADVEVPSSFTFATSRAVALSVSASKARLGGGEGSIQAARIDGKVLYRGPISADHPVAVTLSVPSKDDSLTVKLTSKSGDVENTVAIANGAATKAFD